MRDVIHHVPDAEGLLAECRRVLAPGGRIDVLEPCRYNPLILAQAVLQPAERGELRSSPAFLRRLVGRHFARCTLTYHQPLPLHRLVFHPRLGHGGGARHAWLRRAVDGAERLAGLVHAESDLDLRPRPRRGGAVRTKAEKRAHFDHLAADRPRWIARNRYYHDDLKAMVSFIVPPGASVLEVGCGTGDLLAALQPARGLGVDFSAEMVRVARQRFPAASHPGLEFRVDDAEALETAETFDYVVASDLIGELTDIWAAFRSLRRVTTSRSRLVITYFNPLWEPVLRLGETLGLKTPQDHQNWLTLEDIARLLELNGFEIVTRGQRLLFPKEVPLLSTFLNRFVATLPLVRRLCLGVYLVARPKADPPAPALEPTVSVIIPTRNERGNIRGRGGADARDGLAHRAALRRRQLQRRHRRGDRAGHRGVPGPPRRQAAPPGAARLGRRRRARQMQAGKGDAVRKGFAAATGDVLMILDSDLTVPPEDLPKFYRALVEGRGRVRQRHAPGLPDGEGGHALPQQARQQVLRRALHLALRPAAPRHALRHQGALQARLPDDRRRPRLLRRLRSRSATSTCSSAPPSEPARSSRCRSATARAPTARPRSAASATAGCCSR